MRSIGAFIRLIRPESSLLMFLAVLLPLAMRSDDLLASCSYALPTLFIAMCTFIINDIDDLESDRVNHPARPLPSGRLLPSAAAAFYFVCFALAVLTSRYLVPSDASFVHYVFLFLAINYKYVEEYAPNLKTFYAAALLSFPILIVVRLLPGAHDLYLVAGSAFFFILGREMCMDFLDQAGDQPSFITTMSRRLLTTLAFGLQAAGLLLLVPLASVPMDALVLLLVFGLSIPSLYLWVKAKAGWWAIQIMKLQMFGGLYFLF